MLVYDLLICNFLEAAIMVDSSQLAAQMEPFDSFWEGPPDKEKGYSKFEAFYENNYLDKMPADKNANILVVSCGPGYFLNTLKKAGYQNVLGIDSTAEQIQWAESKGLNCKQARAFEFLEQSNDGEYDAIFCEQEINHLTKDEIIDFMNLCMTKLSAGGTFVGHGLNGANPITGAEALAQNFDHYNTFTEYTFNQLLSHLGFERCTVFPLNLYVFWKNPANYILIAFTTLVHWFFRMMFIIYGKNNKIFTKKIAVVCYKPA